MNNRKRKEAIRETFAFSGEMFESERNQQGGLRLKTTRMSRTCGLSRIGGNGYLCAMMLKPSRMRRCRGRSLLELRRMTAAPSITHARGVFFRAHGNELPKLARFGTASLRLPISWAHRVGSFRARRFLSYGTSYTRTVPPAP